METGSSGKSLFFGLVPVRIASYMALIATVCGIQVHVGDTVTIHYKIIEKETVAGKTKKEKHEEQKERTQGFTGIVIAIKGAGANQSFTVRHMGIGNIGVERIFPVVSPWIKKVTINKTGKTKRAKLYYLRHVAAKEVKQVGEVVKETVEAKSSPTVHASQQPPQG